MNYLSDVTRTMGYRMAEREPEKRRRCPHGFVPAEQYIRERPLCAALQLMAIQHCLDAPVWRRQYALDETMIALLMLSKNRPKPPLKQRQTMPAIGV